MFARRFPRRLIAAVAIGVGTMGNITRGRAAQLSAAPPRKDVKRMSQLASTEQLWNDWVALWNGDLAIANDLVAPSFVAHFAPVGASPAEVRGPAGLTAWIGGATAAFPDYSFTTVVGPLAENDLIAGRWVFRGTYQGGIPGAAAEAVGRPVEYAGTDLLRVADGRIVEYWLSADTLQLLQQVGVLPA